MLRDKQSSGRSRGRNGSWEARSAIKKTGKNADAHNSNTAFYGNFYVHRSTEFYHGSEMIRFR
jgi:hypothetical protein